MTTSRFAPTGDASPNAQTPDPPRERKKRLTGWRAFLRDVLVILVAAIVISFLIKTFLIRSFYIPSESMLDTLHVNDRIIVNELEPKLMPIHHGDIVVFKDPGGWLDGSEQVQTAPKTGIAAVVDQVLGVIGLTAPDSDDHLIKRVIGLPGDKVACCNSLGQMTVDGVPLKETYTLLPPGATKASADPFSVTVPKNSLWVMGDNRYNSRDSRYNQQDPGKGFVPYSDVVGRAMLISWPVNRWTWLDNYPFVFADVDKGLGMTVADPTLRVERRLLREGAPMVIGVDEVGRGAIAGPVAIGVSVLEAQRRSIPAGLRDSKMLSEQRREQLQPVVAAWSTHWAVGLASNEEVDTRGIMTALGLAGARALAVLAETRDLTGAVLLLDGSYDYLSVALGGLPPVTVVTRIKADRDCAVVAAASVLAKVHRDRMMIAAHEDAPEYLWSSNKGYASLEHYAAIDRVGPHPLHRHTWLRQPSLFDAVLEDSEGSLDDLDSGLDPRFGVDGLGPGGSAEVRRPA